MKLIINKVLIIGRTPPPIGGVTIHVSRLLIKLKESKVNFSFFELTKGGLFRLIFCIPKYDILHIHSSNPYIRYFISRLGKIYSVKTVVTFHGDLLRYSSKFKNKLDLKTIEVANFPIVLNNKSYQLAKKINENSLQISAFIPPIIENEILDKLVIEKINDLKKEKNFLFCTNAYNMSFDKDQNEIYGIFELIDFFINNSNYGFVFSDPSGVYSESFKERKMTIPENILIVKGAHSYFRILSLCDVSIRNTSTDGDSLSVKESVFLNKLTLCTNVVSRPKGAIIYKKGCIDQIINSIDINKFKIIETSIKDGSEELINLYLDN